MKRHESPALVLTILLGSCGSIQQYQTLQQPQGQVLQTYVGGTILRLEKQESLPNAFGGADIYGGRRPKGAIELKYLGLGVDGQIKLRVLSTDITTNEDWRRRLGRNSSAATSADAVDFAHDPSEPFEMEGYRVVFLRVEASSLVYKLLFGNASAPPS